jgi:hypothetical protein
MPRINNKIFLMSISGAIAICIIVALGVRVSIKEFKFEQIVQDDYNYYPYNDIEYSNGVFLKVTNSIDIADESEFILKAKITGNREVFYGAVKTQLEILDSIKGDFKEKNAYIYEPVFIVDYPENKAISTFDGYNFLKEGREYILCVKYASDLNTLMYTTPMLGKFPERYDSRDYLVLENMEEKEGLLKYKEYSSCEQLFQNESLKELYFKTLHSLWDLNQ